MAHDLTLYHNPKCSKSRAALSILEEDSFQNLKVNIREYLKEPLSESEILELLRKLDKGALEVIRTKESLIVENNLLLESDADALKALIEYPKLLERPILATKEHALIGRPTEAIRPFLEKCLL